MKELTIEEKAKRYDEAIEIARKIKDGESIDAPDGTIIPVVIFPELKEDEDELIWLKNYISEKIHYLSMDIRDYEDRLKLQKLQKSLAWLEKQGEKKTLCSKCRMENPHDSCSYITEFGNCAIENEQKSTDESEQSDKYEGLTDFERVLTDICSSWIGFELGWQSYIKDNARSLKDMLYKQFHAVQNEYSVYESTELKGKTASEGIEEIKIEDANEVEPKFKIGDWIASKGLDTALIVNINIDEYEVEFIDGSKGFPHIDYVDRFFHLWSLEDANPGDIIYANSKYDNLSFIRIFLKLEAGKSWAYSNVSCNGIGPWIFNYSEGFLTLDKYDFYPATKEYCDILFQKIKDSGYEWDAENKELKEIEEIPIDKTDNVKPKFHEGDWVVKISGGNFIGNKKFAQITKIGHDGIHQLNNEKWILADDIRLWTIEDAEDGDVLVSLSKMHPFIFNGHYDEDTDYVYAYCGISDIIKDDSFYFDKYPDEEFKVWDLAENVRPATRDQRNLLFSKMKDSGYEWDADNKELKLHSNVQ